MKRFWVIVLSLLFILSLGFYNSADAASIFSDVEVGFSGTYKLGKYTPITVVLNNTGDDIEGTLEVTVAAGRDTYAIYSVPVSMPASSVKEYTVLAKIQRFTQSLEVRLVDNRNKLIEKTTIKNLNAILNNSYMLGILTEDDSSLSYWKDGMDSNKLLSNYQPISLSSENLPDRVEVMDNFDIIVLNNIDTSSLSEKQISAINSWVKGGGILITGTGLNAKRTLSGLSPAIIDVTIGNTMSLDSIDSLEKITGKSISGGPLAITELKSESGFVIAMEDNIPLITIHRSGNGFVYTSTFDLGTEPMLTWTGNKVLWDNLLRDTLPANRQLSLIDPDYSYNNRNPDSLLGNISAMELPSGSIMLFVFLLYLGMVGPLNYIVLKKIDRRELSWMTIPVLSIVFAGIIYGFGFSTKGNKIIMNTISIVDLYDGSGQGELTEHVGVFFPGRGNYAIDIDSNSLISVGQDLDYGYYDEPSADTRNVDTRIVQGGSSRVEFDNVNVWIMKAFTIDKHPINIGTIDAKLTYEDDRITGELTNNTEYPLEDFVFYTGTGYQKLGNIATGESKNISLKVTNYYGQHYKNIYYEIQDDLYTNGYIMEENNREFKIRSQLYSTLIANDYMNISDYSTVPNLDARFFAFYEDGARHDIKINGKRPDMSESRGIIMGTLGIEWVNDGSVFIPEGFLSGTLEQQMSSGVQQEGDYTLFNNYGSYAVYSYDLSPYLELEDMIATIHIYMEPGMGEKMIFNINEGDYIRIEDSNIHISDENMDQYVDAVGKVYIKVYMYNNYVHMSPPFASIEGRME